MKIATALLLGLATMSTAHAAGDWRFEAGIAYVSGIKDVADHYEDNLALAGFDVDVDVRVPVGLQAMATYLWQSDVRADIGLGPMFFISGDVNHFELPISTTVGYSFNASGSVVPYVRAGIVYHYVDGDQYSSTSPGPLAAVGVEFTHFAFELATDQSEVEFDALACPASGPCELSKRKLNTYDFVVSAFYRF
jgi:outer membrane protein W